MIFFRLNALVRLVMPEKQFEELKQALMSQQSKSNGLVEIDVEEMRKRLEAIRDRNNKNRQKRAFTSSSLMRSYNL